jgi:hypothetical protein
MLSQYRLTSEPHNETIIQENTIMVLLASKYDQSRFLKAADLAAEKRLKIKSVTEEEVGIGKETKLVVWFTNDSHGLVLNRVNNRTLRGAFGDDCAGWAGKIIVLFPTTAELRGDMKPAMRVRIPPPKGNGQPVKQAAPPPPQPAIDPAEIDDVDPDLNDEIVV